jgi:hypothetical protein
MLKENLFCERSSLAMLYGAFVISKLFLFTSLESKHSENPTRKAQFPSGKTSSM